MLSAPVKRQPLYFPLSTAQAAFLDTSAAIKGFVGGQGAGKSYIGAYDMLRRAKSGRLYMVVAPTYPMLRDASARSFKQVAQQLGQLNYIVQGDFRASIRTTTGGTAEVLFRSGDEADRLRGPNLSGCWLDEASLLEHDVFRIMLARLREGGEQGWMSATFTPKGRAHWTYKVFGCDPEVFLVHARTEDNPFLPEQFASGVRRQYTSTLAAQELSGEFIDAEGNLFRREWLTQMVPAQPVESWLCRYWDKAGTEGGGAHTAGVLMARSYDGRYFVCDVVRGQWSAGSREKIIKQTAELDAAKYGHVMVWTEQEPGSGGKESAEYTVRQLAGYNVHAERVTGKKVDRAVGFAAQCEAGNVYLVNAPWNLDYVDELCSFPEGVYADQVDASSGAFNKLCALHVVCEDEEPEFTVVRTR